MMRQLTAYCSRDVRVADISGKADVSAQRPVLMEKPDVVVGTPSRVLAHLNARNLTLRASLETLVADEADLLFSFGFEDDLKSLLCHLPKIYQSVLMSATLSDDVQALKELLLHNPVTLKLQGSQLPDCSQLQQFSIRCEEEDKFLLIYTLLKLRLVRGKTLVFVGAVERCYRLKLFLEQFSIPACVLNSELPVRSRSHIITQFNQGFYDYIIATDERSLADPGAAPKPAGRGKKKSKKAEKAGQAKVKEYSVSRGVDFQNVANVINFDFPATVESYIHRVGRTARADNPGTALSFVAHTETALLSEVEETLTGDNAESALKPYQFKMETIEGLRYRCRVSLRFFVVVVVVFPTITQNTVRWDDNRALRNLTYECCYLRMVCHPPKDAMRSVTKQAVREARLKEIKQELLNSEKLKTYFEDNPRDLQLLRHDRDLHPAVIKPHLKNIPEYLIPEALRDVVDPLSNKRRRRGPSQKPKPHGVAKSSLKGKNPLRSFRYTKRERNKKPSHSLE
ncbi:probable ATP-dependent RNA helicase DDX56 isoform X3 [Syngnathus scovelli]|nr:probable ATP-dependent RNA helicase DDX56 isoform X3 [Syngnathus scovelli]XP_049593503.1 probable ATP-dependent RNA helicase DDX56 isoform X3 [Syngnathus scovelli]